MPTTLPGDLMMPATASMEADVLEAIDAIRPALQADGGDIVFNAIDDDGVVHVELVGACGTCPVSTMTLKAGVERIIMDRVPGVTAVVADNVDTDAELSDRPLSSGWRATRSMRSRRSSTARSPATGAPSPG